MQNDPQWMILHPFSMRRKKQRRTAIAFIRLVGCVKKIYGLKGYNC